MLKLRAIEKCFKTKAGIPHVLRQISLDIAEGEFVTIMGPSGAGKSTLLSILGMYDHAWVGELYWSEYPVHRMPPEERSMLNKRFVGFVFQQFHLLDDLTVVENLDIPLSYRDIRKSERQALVADLHSPNAHFFHRLVINLPTIARLWSHDSYIAATKPNVRIALNWLTATVRSAYSKLRAGVFLEPATTSGTRS